MQNNQRHELMKMICGNWLSQCLYVAVKLNLADHLSLTQGQTIKHLSDLTRTHSAVLSKLMNVLCEYGICLKKQNEYVLTEKGSLLQQQHPHSLSAYIVLNQELYSKLWGNLLASLKTGEPAYKTLLGPDFFNSLNQYHPELADLYDKAMDQKYKEHNLAIVNQYSKFALFNTVIDIGGGSGGLLTAILKQYPHLNGILFDLPEVAKRTEKKLSLETVATRIHYVSGDFFESLPSSDNSKTIYLMKAILHDWDDEKASQILTKCAKAMKKNDVLLLIEKALASDEKSSHQPLMDMHMFLIHGGIERNLAKLITLASNAGFKMNEPYIKMDGETKLIEMQLAS